MWRYQINTIVELSEEQHAKLGKLVERLNRAGNTWNAEETLSFVAGLVFPGFWDIQLNALEQMITDMEKNSH